jgi:hypothetical protein
VNPIPGAAVDPRPRPDIRLEEEVNLVRRELAAPGAQFAECFDRIDLKTKSKASSASNSFVGLWILGNQNGCHDLRGGKVDATLVACDRFSVPRRYQAFSGRTYADRATLQSADVRVETHTLRAPAQPRMRRWQHVTLIS